HPLHEPFARLLMLALYRSGRQAAALDVYATIRARLIAEIGDEPGPDLQTLHQRVLRRDPALVGPTLNGHAEVATIHLSEHPVEAEPAAGQSPAQLPPDLRAFAGRAEQLRHLDA